jgi:hypothetical protein
LSSSSEAQGVHSLSNTTAISAVIYDTLKEDENISLEDIWPTTPLAELPPSTQTIKLDLTQKTQLGDNAIEMLLHCPSNQENHLYVNGMSGELSSENC